MWERSSGVLVLFAVWVAILTMKTARSLSCEELQCQHGNPCHTFTSNHSTSARCLCSGRWAGPRCQHVITLTPSHVTSSQATLKLDLMTSQAPVTSGTTSWALSLIGSGQQGAESALNYTLVYWRRNHSSLASGLAFVTSERVTCVLLHRNNSPRPVVSGLQAGKLYTVCVESGFLDSCLLSSFTDLLTGDKPALTSSQWPPNCITIFTPKEEDSALVAWWRVKVVAVAAVVVLVVLTVVFVVFLAWRQGVTVSFFLRTLCLSSPCCSRCVRKEADLWDSDNVRHSLSSASSSSAAQSANHGVVFFSEEDLNRQGRGGVKKKVLDRLKVRGKKKKKRKEAEPLSYNTDMTLLPPQELCEAFDSCMETLPLDASVPEDERDSFDDSAAEVYSEHPSTSSAAPVPPLKYKGRNCGRQRLSGKRRGYVTYSARGDRGVPLTTVIESPHDLDPNDDPSIAEMNL